MPFDPTQTVVLLDIEGTTSAIDFVYSVLFPFARTHLEATVERMDDAALVQTAEAFALQAQADAAAGVAHVSIPPRSESTAVLRDAVVRAALDHMATDRKTTALKALQGEIWAGGYANGELRGHVYDDVAPAFARWRSEGRRLYIYSSGSVAAQKLIFGASVAGDLSPQISGYFDTTTGPKKEAVSYRAIAEAIGAAPSQVVFLTDNADEGRAAVEAGMDVRIVRRPDDASPLPDGFVAVTDFNAL